jgi:hypothetical protein
MNVLESSGRWGRELRLGARPQLILPRYRSAESHQQKPKQKPFTRITLQTPENQCPPVMSEAFTVAPDVVYWPIVAPPLTANIFVPLRDM